MSLPNGAKLAPGEFERISKAVAEVESEHDNGLKLGSNHAPRELSVKVVLYAHREYPKHVTIGEDKIKVVNNRAEEEAALAEVE